MIHFLLTSFDVPPMEAKERAFWLHCFRAYTLPSVASQGGDFVWIVALNNHREDEIAEDARRLAGAAGAEIILCDAPGDTEWGGLLLSFLCWPKPGQEVTDIITTHLPAGCALHRDYITNAQKILVGSKRKRCGLSFTGGVICAPTGFFSYRREANPFVSYREPFFDSEDGVVIPLTAANWKPDNSPLTITAASRSAWLYPVAEQNGSCQEKVAVDLGIFTKRGCVL